MNYEVKDLAPGLYLVATPLGAARDITLRALDLLASADVLVAEDTRSLRHLIGIHGIAVGDRPLIAYHDHSKPQSRTGILALVASGKSVVYASEAGTPLIADPGYQLVREALAGGMQVISAPGPSAVVTALTLAGLPTDRFLFVGFPAAKSSARRAQLAELGDIRATLVFYESPKRIAALLGDIVEVLGAGRDVALCRELTKKFEEVRRGTAEHVAESVAADPPRGECVLVIGPPLERTVNEDDIAEALKAELTHSSVKDAAQAVADRFKSPKRQVYQMALDLARDTK